jgi:hypothetical protein
MAIDLRAHLQHPRLILGRHRIDCIVDQVHEHLLEQDSISCNLRRLFTWFSPDEYSLFLQVSARQGKGFLDQLIHA